jgi:hypothetical protein
MRSGEAVVPTAEKKPGSSRWRRGVLAFAVTAALTKGSAVPAQETTASEPALKAAIVFTLAKFTEWPPNHMSDRLTLCVLASPEPLVAAFIALDAKPVQGRQLRVRRLSPKDDPAGCHIMFSSEQPALLAPAHGRLTVGDARQFADSGGMVGLVTANDRIRLEVNAAAAQAAGLKFSSQLLRLARVVGKATPQDTGP